MGLYDGTCGNLGVGWGLVTSLRRDSSMKPNCGSHFAGGGGLELLMLIAYMRDRGNLMGN